MTEHDDTTEAHDVDQDQGERTLPGQRSQITWPDGSTVVVRVLQPDYIRWDLSRGKRNWPLGQDAPFLFMSFLTWSAARREGVYDGTWEQFSEAVADVSALEADAEAGDVIRPTPPAHEAG